ncbi:MAG: hypothetical protein WD424_03020 [Paenibacillaceae bacterium]
MKTHVRLNLYERGIVTSLIQYHHFNPDSARELVVQYIEVIRKLGSYDNCEEHAEHLIQAQRIGYTPTAWLERIHEIELQEIHDKGIPELEHGSEYAHL